jgi:hypothetical protein
MINDLPGQLRIDVSLPLRSCKENSGKVSTGSFKELDDELATLIGAGGGVAGLSVFINHCMVSQPAVMASAGPMKFRRKRFISDEYYEMCHSREGGNPVKQ